MGHVLPLHHEQAPSLEAAAAAFLARESLDDGSRRTYGYILVRLLGQDTPMPAIARDQLAAAAAVG